MAKGQKRSTQERLDAIIENRADRKARFDKLDGVDAATERALREEIVRAEVTARHLANLEAEVDAELAKLNGTETAEVPSVGDESYDREFQNA